MINSLVLKNFMGYDELTCNKFAQVNVIIGKNDTCKTSLLKLLYSSVKSIEIYSKKKINKQPISFKQFIAEKITDIYQPGKNGLGELVNKSAKNKLSVEISFEHKKLNYIDRLHFSFGESTTNTIIDCNEDINTISNDFYSIFIPAKEVLTSLKAVRATRENLHMIGFDDTYLDLIHALVIPTQKGRVSDEFSNINTKLKKLFEGHIEQQDGDDFLFKKDRAIFPMQLTAEGVKKIGILTTLIRNRQLNSNSVLFLDEPETTLHPEAIRELVEILIKMAKLGIQIFVATHNNFVLKQMHLSAKREKVATNCYSLSREKNKSVKCSISDLQNEFPENLISDEAIKMSDDEVRMDIEDSNR